MKKILLFVFLGAFLLSCNSNKEKTSPTSGSGTDTTKTDQPTVELPYKAVYSSDFTEDVSDADLKMVLQTYKDWENGNMTGLGNGMGDTVVLDMSTGDHLTKTRADLLKFWGTYRDSLSSVRIEMQGWQKMYEPNEKEAYVVTWYDEYDTYKGGKVDSASYHDINQIKDGKIIWYAQYKRPKKPQK